MNISADNSKGETEKYQMMRLIYSLVAQSDHEKKGGFRLHSTQSNPMYGPIMTAWTNGIIVVSAESKDDEHSFSIRPYEVEE